MVQSNNSYNAAAMQRINIALLSITLCAGCTTNGRYELHSGANRRVYRIDTVTGKTCSLEFNQSKHGQHWEEISDGDDSTSKNASTVQHEVGRSNATSADGKREVPDYSEFVRSPDSGNAKPGGKAALDFSRFKLDHSGGAAEGSAKPSLDLSDYFASPNNSDTDSDSARDDSKKSSTAKSDKR